MNDLINVTMLYSEIGAICGFILLYLFIKIASSVILIPNKKYIYAMIISLYIMIFTDNLWKWIDNGFISVSIPAAYFINSVYFVALDTFIFFVIFYFRDSKIILTYEEIEINMSRIKFETKVIIGLIFALHTMANFSAPFTKWFFYITDDCKYHYGKYYFFEYFVPYTILALCAIEFLVVGYVKKISGIKETVYKKPTQIVFYQFIAIIMGLLGFKVMYLPLFTTGMTLFLVAFYVRMVEYFVRIDPVTKLHTRRSILKIFNDRVREHTINFTPLTVCVFTINNYYDLNELDGVANRDGILMKISDTFTEVNKMFSQYSPEVARLEGLRFLIVISTDEKKELERYKQELLNNFRLLKEELGSIEINLTYAYVRYNDSMKVHEALKKLEDKVISYKSNNINTMVI